MKRIIPLALICVVLVSSLSVPANASEIENNDFLDLMEFWNPGLTWVVAGQKSISIPLPNTMLYDYMDFVIYAPRGLNGVYVTHPSSGNIALTVIPISSSYYRVYGRANSISSNTITLVIDSPSEYWVQFIQATISTFSFLHYDNECYCEIVANDYNQTIHYVPTDDINYRLWTASTDYTLNDFTLYLWCDDWRNYDYIDFQLQLECASINSISAMIGSTNIGLESYVVNVGQYTTGSYIVNLRLDVTGLTRTKSDYPMIVISGHASDGEVNGVNVLNCSGYILSNTRSSLYYHFASLKNTITSSFSNLYSWIQTQTNAIVSALGGDSSSGDDFKDNSSGLISGLDDISASMDSVNRPSMDSVNADYSVDISDASVLMASLFSEVTGVSWVARIILASCTMGLISYILYGKE